ncbi:MAG: hypothetical protein WAU65_00900 [Candidatus Nanoarchaeia archaeon]
MLENKKNVFWEALLIASVIFILGLLVGIFVEADRLQQINDYYSQAQVSLMDSSTLSSSIGSSVSCTDIISSSIDFADKVYNESLLLEKYEASGKITNSMIIAHSEYDLLRTILWQNLMTIQNKCPNQFNFVIYLYDYNSPDLNQIATQSVWSKILLELKQQEGNNLILVPIAVNSNLSSLDLLTKEFNITSYPAVIINDKNVIYNLESSQQLEKYITP